MADTGDLAHEFDEATAVRPGAAPGIFDATISSDWTVGPKPNGGYLLAMAARGAGAALGDAGSEHRDPLAATAHFVRAPDPGPARIDTVVLRTGRSASQVRASLVQDGTVCVDATFTMGTLTEEVSEPWWSNAAPVEVAPVGECIHIPGYRDGAPFVVAIMDRTDLRLDPSVLGFARGEPSGRADLKGWISFADERPVDPLGLLFFIDALPPASFELASTGWVPTLSLSAYVRCRPAPGPLRIRQWVQSVHDGRFDEVCMVWDSADRLVAQATQLAAIRIPEGTRAPG